MELKRLKSVQFIFVFYIFTSTACFAKDLKKKNLANSLKSTPSWMEKKLDEDFSKYNGAFYTKEDLVNYIKLNQPESREVFFLIEIRDGRVYIKNSGERPISNKLLGNFYLRSLYFAFKTLNHIFSIKNSYYLVCIDDSFCTDKKIPVLTFAKSKDSYSICIPDCEALWGYNLVDTKVKKGIKQYPFNTKIEKAFWRGSTTGGIFRPENWNMFPRSKLALFSSQNEEICDAKFTSIVQTSKEDLVTLKEQMSRFGLFGCTVSIEDHLAYKYLIDVDGNSCTYSRLYWILKSNSLCLKHISTNEQWYYKGLEPYVHYIPFKEDFSDLNEKIHWAKNHPDEVEKIILNANEFANESLKHSDALLYLYKVLERYQNHLD